MGDRLAQIGFPQPTITIADAGNASPSRLAELNATPFVNGLASVGLSAPPPAPPPAPIQIGDAGNAYASDNTVHAIGAMNDASAPLFQDMPSRPRAGNLSAVAGLDNAGVRAVPSVYVPPSDKTKAEGEAMGKKPAAAIGPEPSASAAGATSGQGGPQVAPARYVGAGHDASRNPWEAAGQKRYFDAQGRAADAQETIGSIAAQDAREQAVRVADMAKALKEKDDAAALAEAGRKAEQAERESQINAAIDDVKTQKIDPNRSFNQMSTGDHIVAMIGAALAGWANPGGRNVMLDRLDTIAQRDIDAQKANIENQKDVIKGKQSLLAQMRTRFGDERAAELGAKIAIREHAALQAEQMAATSGSLKAEQAAKGIRAETDARNELDRRQLVDIPTYRPAQMVGGGLAQGTLDVKPDLIIRAPDGTLTVARSEEGAKKTNARIAFENEMGRLQDQAAAIYKRDGRKALVPGTEGYRALKQIREKAIPVQSLASEQGVVREFERDPTLSAVGLGEHNPLNPLADPLGDISQAQKNLRTGSQELRKQHGGAQVAERYVTGPDGKVHQQFVFVSPQAQTAGPVTVRPVTP